MAIKIRRVWKIRPATKVKESAKIYKRAKAKRNLKKILKEQINADLRRSNADTRR